MMTATAKSGPLEGYLAAEALTAAMEAAGPFEGGDEGSRLAFLRVAVRHRSRCHRRLWKALNGLGEPIRDAGHEAWIDTESGCIAVRPLPPRRGRVA